MLLFPLAVLPPNNIALELLIDVKVKELLGGGLSPVTVGDIHCPKIIIIYLINDQFVDYKYIINIIMCCYTDLMRVYKNVFHYSYHNCTGHQVVWVNY